MNGGVRPIRKRNPRDAANLLSHLFIGYIYKTIGKGVRKDLEDSDVYEVIRGCESKTLGDRLEKEWRKEVSKKKPSLLKAILRIHGLMYICLGVSIFVYETTLVTILEPILMGKVTSYFEPGTNRTKSETTLYTIGLCGCSVLLCLCNNQFLLGLLTMSLKIRVAVTSLIYRKCLKLNTNFSAQYNAGKAVTLVSKDILQFFDSADYALMIVVGIPQFCVMMVVSYLQIGVSAIAGASLIFFVLPINLYLGKLATSYRLKTAGKTDNRIKSTQEILTAMRIIKLYTWEKFFSKSLDTLRKREIKDLRILLYIKALASAFGELSSRIAFYICVITYITLGNHITAEKAFIVTGCFGALRSVLTTYMPMGITQLAELKASLGRITSFLLLEEVPEAICRDVRAGEIIVKDLTVKLAGETVLAAVNVEISKGLTLIIGPTGSGKSSFLKAILGDVSLSEGKVTRSGNVSYGSQEPWLFPATVRQNIIFGEKFDEDRFRDVIKVCALERDLGAFANGDQTIVTDRGLNLSKGQKARINLARAIYKEADIYLLDDCLSSVDNRVGKHIFDECIKGFLKNSICVLVSNSPLRLDGDDVVMVLSNCRVKFCDRFSNFVKWDDKEVDTNLSYNTSDPKMEIQTVSNTISPEKNDVSAPDNYRELNRVGQVNRSVYFAYFASGGGWKMLLAVLLFFIAAQVANSWSDYFVSFWVDMEQDLTGFHLNNTIDSAEYSELEDAHDKVIKSYSFVMLGASIFTVLRAVVFYIFSCKASSAIHSSVMANILRTRTSFFDNNLSGNVLNRFSRDLAVIDEQMPGTLDGVLNVILSVLGVFFVVSSVNLYFIIPSLIFMVLLYFARRLYLPTGRSLRRLEGASRSPMIGYINATLEGLTTIRASRAQRILEKEFDNHQDVYSSVVYMNIVASRAFGFYVDMTCAFYIAVITLSFLLFKTESLAGKVGLAISQSFRLTSLLQNGIRQWAELESQMTSTERVLEYNSLNVEEATGSKPGTWPSKGTIEYKNVHLQYSAKAEPVLKNVNFYLESRQKVGVVGRTGAGKTSLVSTLFRMYDYEGSILIDDVDIKTVAIKYLRSKISIIPQDPVLFSGTVRTNLDPYYKYQDKVIWDALDEVEMKNCFKTLDAEITESGTGLSVGERQLLCLARAVVHNNSILVLDEATANLDPRTDNLIQRTIRRRFGGCTVITIAHRLNTVIDSDVIIVMDGGKIVQFGPPKVLLEDKDSLFYCMVKDSRIEF
ncbi:probable multidrug resistance-associated protein lethal(2)03659 [Photinus pyralis]|uniref:probable multidrug resistance-associated protein lethal(2)03659 n=1 Tax=Photinus pyralis TaxID=7054 RepID=UPI0012672A57|nr:probable multidrug resistance-associated protein lethal(2)03659 [Photinus pyralis]